MKKLRLWKTGFDLNLTKNKSLEVEAYTQSDNWFNLWFCIKRKGDHAGVEFRFAFIWFEFSIQFYDHRHWDYKNDTWENQPVVDFRQFL